MPVLLELPALYRCDLERAVRKRAAGEMLAPDEFAALVTQASMEETWRIVTSADGKTHYSATVLMDAARAFTGQRKRYAPHNPPEDPTLRLDYYPPAWIADAAHVWQRRIGREAMLALLHWLTPGSDRNLAWNYAHGVYRVSEGSVPDMPPEWLSQIRSSLPPEDRQRQRVVRGEAGLDKLTRAQLERELAARRAEPVGAADGGE